MVFNGSMLVQITELTRPIKNATFSNFHYGGGGIIRKEFKFRIAFSLLLAVTFTHLIFQKPVVCYLD